MRKKKIEGMLEKGRGMRNKNRMYWLFVCIYAIIIFIHSSIPYPPRPPGILAVPYFDKILHFFLYMGFGFLLYLAVVNSRYPFLQKYPIYTPILMGFFYGVTDEIHQFFVPGRCPDVFDLLVDVIGVTVAQVISVLVEKKRKG